MWTGDTPTVVLLTQSMLVGTPTLYDSLALLSDSVVVIAADDTVLAAVTSPRVFLTLPASRDRDATLRLLAGAYRMAAAAITAMRAERELKRAQ